MPGKKFRFSLQSVLRLRTHETEGARQVMLAAQQQVQAQEAAVQTARQQLDDVAQRRPSGALAPGALTRHEAYRHQARQALDAAVRQLQQRKAEAERARLAFMEKRAAEEALRTLREEEETRHRQEVDAAEASFLDDQAVSRYYRQRKAAQQ